MSTPEARHQFRYDVSEPVLEDVVRRLVTALDPDKVVMFGSRARGDHRPDSDLDLMIVKDTSEPKHRRDVEARTALHGLRVPMDVLWFTPYEVWEWSRVRNYVSTTALREGRVLYEKGVG